MRSAPRNNNATTKHLCFDCCSGANPLRSREAAGLRLMEATHPPGLKVQPHAHERIHFCLLLEGIYEEHWGSQVVVRRPGSLALTASDAVHSNRIHNTGIRFFTIELAKKWIERVNGAWELPGNFTQFENGPLPWLGTRLYREFRAPDELSPLAIEGLTLELLAGAARHKALLAQGCNGDWLKPVKELLHERFHAPITIAEVAQSAGVHPVSLARAFRRTYRCTIGEYVRRLRVEFASQQLAASDQTLLEIALAAGFSEQSHFCRTFKRLTGLTPSEYRLSVAKANSNLER